MASTPDGTHQLTEPDGTVWTTLPDGSSTVRAPDGTLRTNTPGFEVTNYPDGRVHMSFPGGVELDRLPDGTATWSSSVPTATLDTDGFDEGAPTDATASSATDAAAASEAETDTWDAFQDASSTSPTAPDATADASGDGGGTVGDELTTLRIAAGLDGESEMPGDDDAGVSDPGAWTLRDDPSDPLFASNADDPLLGSATEADAQFSGADLSIDADGAATDSGMAEQPLPEDQFIADAAGVEDAAGDMPDDFDAPAIALTTDMTTDEELA